MDGQMGFRVENKDTIEVIRCLLGLREGGRELIGRACDGKTFPVTVAQLKALNVSFARSRGR